MDPKQLKETLDKGGMVFGCMLSSMSNIRFSSTLAGSTLDFCVIDSEHGSRDRKEIQELCYMLRNVDMTPIVRVPTPQPHYVAMALDAGAGGVLVPYCETAEEVRSCVATAKWHPMKGEYLRRAVEEGVFPSQQTKEYLRDRRAGANLVLIGIESEPAYENLDNILSVEGIDGMFIGPNDMTTSLGVPNENSHPRYLEVVGDIIKRAEERGIPTMVHEQTIDTSVKAIELGARFVMYSSDGRLMQIAMREQFKQLREAAVRLHGKGEVVVGADTMEEV